MNKNGLEELLQECLAANEAGLSPEESLSAFPERRAELEPLLRQALRLRMAFTRTPTEAFRERVRQDLFFAAGREVRQAFTKEPSAEFVGRARSRLLFAAGREVSQALVRNPRLGFIERARLRLRSVAGANAQEALRAVPPPRLPFWMNARRRLLDAASAQPVRAAGRPMALALRTSVSAAVIVIALAVAGLAYFASPSQPTSVSAELASLEEQIKAVEQQTASGVPVSPDVLVDLSRRTAVLVDKINTDQSAAPLAEKLPGIIERQKDVVNQAVGADATTAPPQLQQAQQQLNQSEEKVRLFAARADTPTISTPAPASTSLPPTATAAPKTTPGVTPTTAPLAANQLRVTPLANDTAFGVAWSEYTTEHFRAAIPRDWRLIGTAPDANGVATLDTPGIQVQRSDAAVILVVNTGTGQINAIVNGQALLLREPGANGKSMGVEELVAKAGPFAGELSHILSTAIVTAPATSTPAPPPATPSTPPPSPTP